MIEVQGLTKRYFDREVVRSVSFFVPEGEVLGFLGPNGAGKTTTMRMICAFLPPTAGTVKVAGLDLAQDPLGVRSRIGYLPEHVALYPEMRVEEFLRFRAAIEGVPAKEVPERLAYVVERCMLGDVQRQVIGTLSKGYRQRVGLAAALIHRPPVLILDEPTVGLDPRQIVKIRELIVELGRDHTVILSTHILPEVEQVCQRVLIIDDGRIVADGTPDALRTGFSGLAAVTVELEGADGAAASEILGRIAGVEKVDVLPDGRLQLAVRDGKAVRREVFRAAVERGWEVLELSQSVPSLEDVFLRLTTREEAVAETTAEVSHA
ncbi:MAG: ABC transporter ATP-binding protein [Thermoanaerobaculum sp.]|nr:ABC transporter ATP-binding protein [Thermoanaerobaculum sp.]MDW7967214.1 ATP-binding cassette domain-containing protein [Thermoanaerobaculum sp.]